MYETKRQNVVKGYALSRISPLTEDDTAGFETLDKMLKNIDPALQLKKNDTSSGISDSLEKFKQFYYDNIGKPGTPEFENRIKEINKIFKNT